MKASFEPAERDVFYVSVIRNSMCYGSQGTATHSLRERPTGLFQLKLLMNLTLHHCKLRVALWFCYKPHPKVLTTSLLEVSTMSISSFILLREKVCVHLKYISCHYRVKDVTISIFMSDRMV